jgi:transcriptional regulator with XRE-family HTH domain
MAWFERPRDPQQQLGFEMIGAMIRRRRIHLGWTQRNLEAYSGINQAVISRLENGKQSGLRWSRFAELVQALGGLDVAPRARPWPGASLGLDGDPTTPDAALGLEGDPSMHGAAVGLEGDPSMHGAALGLEGDPPTPGAALGFDGDPTTPDAALGLERDPPTPGAPFGFEGDPWTADRDPEPRPRRVIDLSAGLDDRMPD